MPHKHTRNTIRYFLIIVIFLTFLFFSNDFGLIDVQKTAIVVAAGIDRDGTDFIVTTQIAIPQAAEQGKSTKAVQIVSRGKTVAEAFSDVNAKTGWYPKLVFCNLILLGEETTKQNVFDALDFFLLDEYLSDNCLIATCDGKAQELLDTNAVVEALSSAAIEKVLSRHAEQVGSVYTSTLRTFAIGYHSDDASGLLPIVKKQSQQPIPPENSEKIGGGGQDNAQSGEAADTQPPQSSQSKTQNQPQNNPLFSASETALFKHGKRVGTLTAEETFAANALLNKLRLAPYSITTQDAACTLTFKQNAPKIQLQVAKNGMARLKIHLTVTAGLLDYSQALPESEIADVGDVPAGAFSVAQKKLTGEIIQLFEKTRALDCDIFRVRDRAKKTGNPAFHRHESILLSNTVAEVTVHFKNVR